MTRIVDEYDRMTRVEPRKSLVRVDGVVGSVALAHGLPTTALLLAGDSTECDADPVLLESARENVVRNAVEAASGSEVRVETHVDAANGAVVIRVTDRGPAMDARGRPTTSSRRRPTAAGSASRSQAASSRRMAER